MKEEHCPIAQDDQARHERKKSGLPSHPVILLAAYQLDELVRRDNE